VINTSGNTQETGNKTDRPTVLITGWNGNVGAFVLPLLRRALPNAHFVGVARHIPQRPPELACDTTYSVDLGSDSGLEAVFQKHTFALVVHIAHITFSPRVLALCDKYRVPDAVCVHTTGVFSKHEAYSANYKRIETHLKENPLQNTTYTVLRPTMIYGNSSYTRDQNLHKLLLHLQRARVFPVFGSGNGKMQPVHGQDLAQAIVQACVRPETRGKTYEISGGSVATYHELLHLCCKELGHFPLLLPVPTLLAVAGATVYEKISARPRITREQVIRLSEDKTFSHEAAERDLGFAPRTLAQGLREQVAQMRRDGILPFPVASVASEGRVQ
jgi:nucleoside-diphosphate-sugar epimerase